MYEPGHRALEIAAAFCIAALLATSAAGSTTGEDSPLYVKIRPDLIVNLRAPKVSFLMLTAAVRGEDAGAVTAVKHHMAAIRHHLIMLLSSKEPRELLDPQAKETTRQQVLEILRSLLEEETGRPGVAEVYFTDLLVE